MSSSRLFNAALIASVPVFLLTIRGLSICGWPANEPPPEGEVRKSFEVSEYRWREKRAKNTNDPAMWNEEGAIVLEYPPEERAAEQERLIKMGVMQESSRIRMLTPAEQAEMETRVAQARARNDALDFKDGWRMVGIPLGLLAAVLSFLCFCFAKIGPRRLGFMVVLAMANAFSVVLALAG